ncbi:CGNR zinc finger domain-containing protein [Streptomyces sp. NPDC090306]|uniref:CGNR zinc finger domain-containing protein n=1 Tax=Streptomyces sp. NPDC090306 TaxID=3365961 RepID=UPI0037FE8729
MALGAAPAPYELRFDAGRVCLDLLATTHPGERIGSVGPLRAWITGAGLVPPGTPLAHADLTWPAEFRELRYYVDQLVRAGLQLPAGARGRDAGLTRVHDGARVRRARPRVNAAALARVNEAARAAPPAARAVLAGDGAFVRELDGPASCAALLAVVARDAVDLLTDPVARAGLRQCEGDNCPIVYLDTSRGRRRRWCSSEVCGNRERVARHRRRAAALT